MPLPSLPRRHLLITAAVQATAWRPASAGQRPPWRVGPGLALQRVADALLHAGDGDTIEVLSGSYAGDVAVIHQKRLTIIGIGQRPVIVAAGQHAEGKAIWVVRDGDVRIENIAFQGARVADGNGAGIRFERGQLQLHRCAFSDNQMGVLTGNDGASVLEVHNCEFIDAPVNPIALPHLLYAGRIKLLRVTGSRFTRGREGHLIKSRAAESRITHNQIDDGPQGQASYEIDLPNGGVAHLEGNTVVQGTLTRNPVMLAYGAEGAAWADNRLTLRDNTFINHLRAGGWFVRVWADRLPADTRVRSEHNRWLGPGSLLLGTRGESVDDVRGPAPD